MYKNANIVHDVLLSLVNVCDGYRPLYCDKMS